MFSLVHSAGAPPQTVSHISFMMCQSNTFNNSITEVTTEATRVVIKLVQLAVMERSEVLKYWSTVLKDIFEVLVFWVFSFYTSSTF